MTRISAFIPFALTAALALPAMTLVIVNGARESVRDR